MLKYVIKEKRVQIDPLSITIEPLAELWEQDLSSDKHTATKVLTYIHLVSQIDKDAPYFSSAPGEVRLLVRQDQFGSYDHSFGDKEDFVEKCVTMYQKAFEEPEFRAVRVLNAKIDETQELIDTTKVKITTTTIKGSVAYTSNFSILKDMMLNLVKISKTKEELMASIEKQKSAGVVVRGGKHLSFLEKELKSRRITEDMPEGDQTGNIPIDEL